ncbi:MAG: peptide chain release factor N(5)-glutamine methyltransferase [Candidatus Omnitrophica bacterium]|nr:peptide chain release factor N(5)-glutamine methyltransferase [Candidatus Omnitrophota bacterium]MDD5081055.1 peptide chain release factor N(5)-glutamine methyltransferase [Candidatus Omnitrophota bacterium]MDD5441404.1 peptide chain release factor N(5)-glutamine methyltransferase [Candidatus Omnitrophota bacterium]
MNLKDWYNNTKDIFLPRDMNFLIKETFGEVINICDSDINIPAEKLNFLDKAKHEYLSGKPLAYSLGKEEFYGHTFNVNQDVLIPRVETEIITEKTLEYIKKYKIINVLDLCCGSGVIGLTLKRLVPGLNIVCSDISEEALDVAKKNALKDNLKIRFYQSDIFAGLNDNEYQLIVTNPPYVESSQIEGSLTHEPFLALDGGITGFDLLDKIFSEAGKYLTDKGFLIFEMGYNQKDVAKEKIEKYGYKVVEWIKDYSDNWRGGVLLKSK